MPNSERALPGHRLTAGFKNHATKATNHADGLWHVIPTGEGKYRVGRGAGYVRDVVFTGNRSQCVDVAMRLNGGTGLKAAIRAAGAE